MKFHFSSFSRSVFFIFKLYVISCADDLLRRMYFRVHVRRIFQRNRACALYRTNRGRVYRRLFTDMFKKNIGFSFFLVFPNTVARAYGQRYAQCRHGGGGERAALLSGTSRFHEGLAARNLYFFNNHNDQWSLISLHYT